MQTANRTFPPYKAPTDQSWAMARETDFEVEAAIRVIADHLSKFTGGSSRTPEAIWEAPTQIEWGHVEMILDEWVDCGEIEPGWYSWGQEPIQAVSDVADT